MKETNYLDDEEIWFRRFKKLPFLKSFNDNYLKEIIASTTICHYDPGENVFEEGDRANSLFILLFGEVRVCKRHDEIARFSQTGDLFGELAVINSEARSATVAATCKTICLAIHLSFLEHLNELDRMVCYSLLYRLLIEIIADRMRTTSRELANVKRELAELKAMKR